MIGIGREIQETILSHPAEKKIGIL
jgi:hypothetical protein